MTAGVSPAQCREALERIYGEEIAALRELDGLLSREHEFLAANDIDALEAASAARQDAVARLLRLEDERRDLSRMLGRDADLAGTAAMIAWCDPQGVLRPTIAEHGRLSGQCRQQNERNGALVGARMARLSNMLGMLAGASAQPATYGRSGTQGPALPPAGRLVAARA
jgi:flagellar biosynthesis/type III secretory pathway chaperone